MAALRADLECCGVPRTFLPTDAGIATGGCEQRTVKHEKGNWGWVKMSVEGWQKFTLCAALWLWLLAPLF
jgi:hypothetical protein